ncbi:uncharacterized protein ARMOST_22065 [Armillaria ostoyae]|uniref:Uncharacterized protein n=1 Tax=Armillaria ostoyae TaxID=47428 RepID=A0A284SBW2_ARMOS|nr:uncharacterized protein ARMOST_22065 [Armillaria ostoyae]
MATQANIPLDLTDDEKAFIFLVLDTELNSLILYALLHGIYTGILASTLWNIFINKCWPIRRVMVVVIILLHALTTINFSATWSFMRSSFIDHGQSLWTVSRNPPAFATFWEVGISAFISTILADAQVIWCCWMIWGRRWLVVLLPIFFLLSATVSKIMEIYLEYTDGTAPIFIMLYTSFNLATTLWCTLIISYRILTVTGTMRGGEGRQRVYRRFIEVLVESSALYSVSLILYLVFSIRNGVGIYYLDVIVSIAKGIAATLIVGRFTAGHRARPDDSWQGSVMASVSIILDHSRASFREDDRTGPMHVDLEAQHEFSLREPIPTLRSVSVAADSARQNTDVSPETSPHIRNRSLFHDRLSLYEDITLGSTVVGGATASSR